MAEAPAICADLSAMGGRFKVAPEDFEVEEIPAYLPAGQGEHLFLWIEKRDISTPELVRALSRQLGIAERSIGYAGLKDRQAIARQFLSIPASGESKLASVSIPQLRILESKRHPHKLRTGQLKGNRFRILIREPTNLEAGREVLQRILRMGLPNYFGTQRFGAAGSNARMGKALLQTGRAPSADRFERKLFLSAYQSLLFNRALTSRIQRGDFSRALAGDVMRRTDSGGLFVCVDPERDQPRVENFEISPAGPLFGPKMFRAQGEVAEVEDGLLAAEGMTLQDFERGGREARGGRRPYRIPLARFELSMEEGNARLAFELPKGAFATVLLRELIR